MKAQTIETSQFEIVERGDFVIARKRGQVGFGIARSHTDAVNRAKQCCQTRRTKWHGKDGDQTWRFQP